MAEQMKPDTPTILKRIIQEASLPGNEAEKLQKLNRQQLVELYLYITELKRTNKDLHEKIELMTQGRADDKNN